MGSAFSEVELWKRYKEEEEEAREIRRKSADWEFIRKLPAKQRLALEYYIEKGDFHLARKLCGMSVEEFRELLRAARVPVVV